MIEPTSFLVQRIQSIYLLNDIERHALMSSPFIERTFEPHTDIAREGDQPTHCCLITKGWVYRYQTLREGERQILAFHIRGDTPDLQGLHLRVADHNLAAMTTVTAHFISHDHVFNIVNEHPRIGSAFWKITLVEAAIYRRWILNIGCKEAMPRMAHLFCEMFMRMRTVGLTNGLTCYFPLTQSDLADALGVTPVHVSRVLREMRIQELISLDHRTLTILDWRRLMELSQFDPTYLHQDLSR